jgi:hypothetical protein
MADLAELRATAHQTAAPGELQGRILPLECPSAAACSSVKRSNSLLDLCGAKGIRTPDLLHAMPNDFV